MESRKEVCKTITVFSKRHALSVESNGPCQPHTRLFEPGTHWYHPKQSLVSRSRTDSINNSRLGLISVDLMLSHSTPRVACVAYPLSQLEATHEGNSEGNRASPALLHSATPYTCLSCLHGLFPTSCNSEGPQANQGNGQEKAEKCKERGYILILKCEFPFGSKKFFLSLSKILSEANIIRQSRRMLKNCAHAHA